MLKNIVSAIGAALRGVFALARSFVSIPGRLASVLFGGAAAPPAEDTPAVQDLAAQVAQADAEARDNYAQISAAIWRWCVDSLIAEGPVAVPAWLPRPVKEWLPGLTPQEAETIVSADKQAIQAHVCGLYGLPGVSKVQRLAPVKEWSTEPACGEPAPVFAVEATREPASPRA
ncbi:hypothetical protein BSZ19_18535 [Bradyrhizobium japonicum]|uniref:Uncharacterized protein n=1 Tax=Bradyrhizobium japonicum TaxID=375 RepID=A0A1Y2JQA8_BRAJP|nr:hypothetical protein [Bradyrhizobium japonicum]OSJ32549.1 hypothetical protein BSZ19_18535 [Bradyrhizobium japonicum]